MVLTGYKITVCYNDSIVFDSELKPEQLKVEDGDVFVAKINETGSVVLTKQNG